MGWVGSILTAHLGYVRIFAGFPRLGAGVAVARTLETWLTAVLLGAMVGVVEMESWDELRMEDIVACWEVPKPPTAAQRRRLRVPISRISRIGQTK